MTELTQGKPARSSLSAAARWGRRCCAAGCAAMLASRFVVIEPAGMPGGLADHPAAEWHRAPEEVAADLAPDAVVFAVKPQVFNELLPAYRGWVRPETLFLSIAAGKTIAGIARHLGDEAAIIRCMPNTPAAIGRAITVACPNRMSGRAAPSVRAAAGRDRRQRLGRGRGADGCGHGRVGQRPGLCISADRGLAAAGIGAGLPPELSLRLARATVAGPVNWRWSHPRPPARLRENVTSPGGTTRAALDVLMAERELPEPLRRRRRRRDRASRERRTSARMAIDASSDIPRSRSAVTSDRLIDAALHLIAHRTGWRRFVDGGDRGGRRSADPDAVPHISVETGDPVCLFEPYRRNCSCGAARRRSR